MVKSRKKRNLQSKKKYQKRNYRVRLSSKKRNLRRNNKVVSRKRPKRYQRGGAEKKKLFFPSRIGLRILGLDKDKQSFLDDKNKYLHPNIQFLDVRKHKRFTFPTGVPSIDYRFFLSSPENYFDSDKKKKIFSGLYIN